MRPSPTGEQWRFRSGDQSACVVEVGGGLRSYAVGGLDIVAGFRVDQPCVHGRGQVLMPWPNRIRDGKYEVDGTAYQLPLTEVARRNASHGLVRWALWDLIRQEPDQVEVGYRLHPQPGWPWHLDLRQVYRLTGDGLAVTVTAANPGAAGDPSVPFGFGAHPYVATGGVDPARITVTIPGRRHLLVDSERMLPTGTAAVAGTAYDFAHGGTLAQAALDTAFTDLSIEDDGGWRVLIEGIGAGSVAVWGGPELPWLQVFAEKAWLPVNGPDLPGIAVEPMSCPPDAFNSGTDLVWIEPGGQWSASWGIAPLERRGA